MTRTRGWVSGAALTVGLVTSLMPAAALRGVAGSAQDQRPPVFRGGVNFVYVDVYPRRDGRLIEGLTSADFQISEDGKPQHVETFEFVRIEPNAPDTERRDPNTKEEGDRLAADPHNRLFVVYLDLYHTTFVGAHDTRRPLLDFLSRTIGPTDLFGVMTPELPVDQLVFGRRIETLEGELTKYFDWGERDKGVFPRTAVEGQLATCLTGEAPSLGDALVALQREDLMMTNLEELMVRLRDLRDERKNLLLISEGWVPRPPQTTLANLASGTIPRIGPDPGGRLGIGGRQGTLRDQSWCDRQISRLASIDFDRRFHDLLMLANRANVSFYPVDVGGLRAPGAPLASPSLVGPSTPQELLVRRILAELAVGSVRTLPTLAENTDGRAVVNTNDLNAGFRRISDDLSAYYLLGYASTNTNLDGKFRRIDVKVSQPKVSVAARRGYLAPVPAPARAAAAARPTVPVRRAVGRRSRRRGRDRQSGDRARPLAQWRGGPGRDRRSGRGSGHGDRAH